MARITCATCGTDLPPPGGPGRRRKFCGDACSRMAQNEVRRLNRRLERAERELERVRVRHPAGVPYRLEQVERLEARLREVLKTLDDQA